MNNRKPRNRRGKITRREYEQIQDNREGVARCIGIRLVEKIEKYKSLAV